MYQMPRYVLKALAVAFGPLADSVPVGRLRPPSADSSASSALSADSSASSAPSADTVICCRPTQANRYFHSAETLETIFMRQVLQEVQQRSFAVSLIWLHDGFWISSSVSDNIFQEAEKTALKSLFPSINQEERILRIKSLSAELEIAKGTLADVKPSPLFPPCSRSRRRVPKFTREFPCAKFSSRQAFKRKASTYFARISKRLRTC